MPFQGGKRVKDIDLKQAKKKKKMYMFSQWNGMAAMELAIGTTGNRIAANNEALHLHDIV